MTGWNTPLDIGGVRVVGAGAANITCIGWRGGSKAMLVRRSLWAIHARSPAASDKGLMQPPSTLRLEWKELRWPL